MCGQEAYLIVLNGPLKGGVFVLSKISVFEIGRADGCHIKLPDDNCGFNHARISVRQGEWWFTNLNEERGSSINDIKVDNRVLEGFEVIRVGTTELQFTKEIPQRDAATGGASAAESESRSVGEAPTMLGAGASSPPLPTSSAPAPRSAETAAPPPIPSPVSELPPLEPSSRAPVPSPAVSVHGGSAQSVDRSQFAPAPPTPSAVEPSAPSASVSLESQIGQSRRTEALAGVELPPMPEPQATARGFRVRVIDGCEGDLGREVDFLQGATCIVGRSVSSDFMLVDGKISRAHCSIELRDGVLILCDLDSSNGTVVNGERIQKTVIKPGDYIRLGFTVLGIEEIELLEN